MALWQCLLLILTFALVASENLNSHLKSENGQKILYFELIETKEGVDSRKDSASDSRADISVNKSPKLSGGEKLEDIESFSTPTGPAAATGSFDTPTGPAAATGSFDSGSTPTGPAAATGSFDAGSTPTGPAAATGSFGAGSTPTGPAAATGSFEAGSTPTGPAAATGSFDAGSTPTGPAAATGSFGSLEDTPTSPAGPTGSFDVGSTPTGPAAATGSFPGTAAYDTPTSPAGATGSFGYTRTAHAAATGSLKDTPTSPAGPTGSFDTGSTPTGPAAATGSFPGTAAYDTPTSPAGPTGSFEVGSTPTGPAAATGSFPGTAAYETPTSPAGPTGSFEVGSTPTGPAAATGSFPETAAYETPTSPAGPTGSFEVGSTPTGPAAATGSFPGTAAYETPTSPAGPTGSFEVGSTPTGPAAATGSFPETRTSAPTSESCYSVGESCSHNKECCSGECSKEGSGDDSEKVCKSVESSTPTAIAEETAAPVTPTGPAAATGSFPGTAAYETPTSPAGPTGSFEVGSTPTGPAAATGSFPETAAYETPTSPAGPTGSFDVGSTPTGPAAATGSFPETRTSAPTSESCYSVGESCSHNKECCSGECSKEGSGDDSEKVCKSVESSTPTAIAEETAAPVTPTGPAAATGSFPGTAAYETPTSPARPTGSFEVVSTPTGPAAATGSFPGTAAYGTPTSPAGPTGSFNVGSTPTGPAAATGSFPETRTSAPTSESCYSVGESCTHNKECCSGECSKEGSGDDSEKVCKSVESSTPTVSAATISSGTTAAFATPTGPAAATTSFSETVSFSTPTEPAAAAGSFTETFSFSTPTGLAAATGSSGTTASFSTPTGPSAVTSPPALPTPTGPPGESPCGESSPGFLSDDFCRGTLTNSLWTTEGGHWVMSNCKYASLSPNGSAIAWVGVKDPRSILWTEYRVEARMFLNSSCKGDAGVIFRADSIKAEDEKFYYFGVGEDAVLSKANGDEWDILNSQNLLPSALDEWVTLHIDLKGAFFKVKVQFEGTETEYELTGRDDKFFSGSVGLRTFECPVVFDYIDVVGPTGNDYIGILPCKDCEDGLNSTTKENNLRSRTKVMEKKITEINHLTNDIIEADVIETGRSHEFDGNILVLGSLAVAFFASIYLIINVIQNSSRRTGYEAVPV